MRVARAISETIHLTVLGVWGGAMIMIGVTAAIGFPTMKALDPKLPEYAQFSGDHWMIAAGKVMNKAFLVSDWIGVVCAVLAAITLVVVLVGTRTRFARPATVLRTVALAAAIAALVYSVGVLRPHMQHELRAFWDAARAGDNQAAAIHQKAFDEMHPQASFLIVAQLVLALWALGTGGYAAVTESDWKRAHAKATPTEEAP